MLIMIEENFSDINSAGLLQSWLLKFSVNNVLWLMNSWTWKTKLTKCWCMLAYMKHSIIIAIRFGNGYIELILIHYFLY